MKENNDFEITNEKYYKKLGLTVLAAFIIVFGLWATFAPLKSSIPAVGKVIAAGNNKTIQHLEGGIIKNIFVKEGDFVEKNQKLIEIDETQTKIQLEIILSQYYEELGIESRLLAERDNSSFIVFNKEIINNEKIIENQKKEFESKKQQMKEEENIFKEKTIQLENKIRESKDIIETKKELLISYKNEIQELEELYKEHIIDKTKLIERKRDKLKIEEEINSLKTQTIVYLSQIRENKSQISNIKKNFLKEVESSIQENKIKIETLKLKKEGLEDTLSKLIITSPENGFVSNLQVFTVGGVIGNGSKLMEIVPEGDNLIIEGKISATEVNNVYKGLNSFVIFPNFAHIKSLNDIEGKVIYVAADAILDEKTQVLYYPIKISISKKGKEELIKNKLIIQPGMPAEIMITVKEHTLLEYLIDPVKNISRKAFNEL